MESRDAVAYLLMDDQVPALAGYFSLSAAEVRLERAPGAMARRSPDPIPAIRMGRFAIALTYQGHGWGADLLREALLRAVSAGWQVGVRVMLVDAISDAARDFYLRFGFEPSPINPLQMRYDLRAVAASTGLEPGG
jgi:GNAT superfamily N-acetyltransferase